MPPARRTADVLGDLFDPLRPDATVLAAVTYASESLFLIKDHGGFAPDAIIKNHH
jgi:hypothetical protein